MPENKTLCIGGPNFQAALSFSPSTSFTNSSLFYHNSLWRLFRFINAICGIAVLMISSNCWVMHLSEKAFFLYCSAPSLWIWMRFMFVPGSVLRVQNYGKGSFISFNGTQHMNLLIWSRYTEVWYNFDLHYWCVILTLLKFCLGLRIYITPLVMIYIKKNNLKNVMYF